MQKARCENRDRALEIFKEHCGKITNRTIADMQKEKENTISNWKTLLCKDSEYGDTIMQQGELGSRILTVNIPSKVILALILWNNCLLVADSFLPCIWV